MIVETDKIRKAIEEKKNISANSLEQFVIKRILRKLTSFLNKDGDLHFETMVDQYLTNDTLNEESNIDDLIEKINAHNESNKNKPDDSIIKQYMTYLNNLAGYEIILAKLKDIEEISKKIVEKETINPQEYFKLV